MDKAVLIIGSSIVGYYLGKALNTKSDLANIDIDSMLAVLTKKLTD